MTLPKKKAPSGRSARKGAVSASRARVATGQGDGTFPPLITSLETFLVDGSDLRFRDLIYKLLSTSSFILQVRDRFATHMGVSGPQYSMMVAIGDAARATVGEIADRLHVSSPFVTAEVGKLIERGIIERSPNETDRRSSLLALTKRGCDMIRDVGPLRRKTNDMIFGPLTQDQVQALHKIMDKLLASSERALYVINGPN